MASIHEPQAFTVYGWIACVWVLIVSFQYGYHISSLNQIQAVLTCRVTDSHSANGSYGLPTCIPMTDATFSVVTSVYTVGGLLGSLGANLVMDRRGRKGACLISALSTAAGAALMGMSGGLAPLVLGRVLTGIGAGLGLCVGPIFLSELAPPKKRGSVGVLTQFAIVVGIMITQSMGLTLATPRQWRIVLFFSALLAVAQFLASPLMIESPTWLVRHGQLQEKDKVARRIWLNAPVSHSSVSHHDSQDQLLGIEEADRNVDEEDVIGKTDDEHEAAISVPQLLLASELRRPLAIVCFSMLVQQLSGINAVLYYSNDILSKALPDLGPYVSLGITIVNFFMTATPLFLLERVGRKQLLSLSAAGAILSLLGVGFGLNSNLTTLASVTTLTFVASFAIGIGPVPFVMIPEVSPHHAVSALSSVGLSLNWIANFLVGLVFLPLRNFLSHGDPGKEGLVFYVFAGILSFCTFILFRVYRG